MQVSIIFCSCALIPFYIYIIPFAEGQKIAKKLSLQITKETRKLKALLQEYNAYNTAVNDGYESLPIEDVLDSSKLAYVLNPKLSAYSADKKELIDAYLLLKRSIEEKELIQSEMKNVISYYEYRVKILSLAMSHLSQSNVDYKRGGCALLAHLHKDAVQHLLQSRKLLLYVSEADHDSLHVSDAECYDSDSSFNSDSDSDFDIS